ncbi:benzoate 4-monooxygenase cytochrome P450 [Xylaria cubensis]|nr:benzoate 4-monooxygenase cytochrome P450 [Xylaria cubensis]
MMPVQLQSVLDELLNTRTIAVLFLIGLSHWLYSIIYNLYFHPLRNVPGPKIAAISDIPHCWWFMGGRHPYEMLELHGKYGRAVRIAPNEVSFNSAQSWKDIYGARPGHEPFVKGHFYSGGSFAGIGTTSIISERRPEVHRQMRNYLANAFSDRSILEQEEIVAASVDAFIHIAGVRGSRKEGFNLSKTLQSLSFDITGDLSFGETFGALKTEEPHPWIFVSLNAMTQGEIVDVLNRFPILQKVVPVIMGKKLKKLTQDTKKNEELSIKAVESRVKRTTDRKDFLTRILEDRDPSVVSNQQIAAHASDFVIAGSDTTATTLASLIYYLLRNPTVMSRLTEEIRTSFQSYEEITYNSTASLQYLRAALLEAMRIYPPVPMGLPRAVPEGGDTVDGVFLPGGVTVSTNPIATCLSNHNFHDPWSFKPERWIGKNECDDLECSQPFSLGTRGCMGRNLAWLSLRTISVKLIWVYDLELVNSSMDWHQESQMHTLWRKPDLFVRARNRGVRHPLLDIDAV